jgi:hypothetical protein
MKKDRQDEWNEYIKSKTLQELDGEDWGESTYSPLVKKIYRLRRVPLREFTTENLRVMIGQQVGLLRLVPIALELLRRDPFAQGDMDKGDLLRAIFGVETVFWLTHPSLYNEAEEIAGQVFALLPSLGEEERQWVEIPLKEEYAVFQSRAPRRG